MPPAPLPQGHGHQGHGSHEQGRRIPIDGGEGESYGIMLHVITVPGRLGLIEIP
jgi:hypothetical protein